MYKLRSERIRIHLQISILVIVICLLMLGIPWISKSYQGYQAAKHTVLELNALIAMSELSDAMLAERLPTNVVNHSTLEERNAYIKQLQSYRDVIDTKLISTANVLNEAGFDDIAWQLRENVAPVLQQARYNIDSYIAEPKPLRQIQQLDRSIQDLFVAWDSAHDLLRKTLVESNAYGIDTTNHYAMLLLLCDLQDHASRVASYIKAPTTFGLPIQDEQRIKTLQNYNRSYYLWNLVGKIQPSHERNFEFQQLHQRVKNEFLDPSHLMIQTLLEESKNQQAYSYSPKQVTTVAVNSFSVVLDLQRYMINKRLELTQQQKLKAKQEFVWSCLVVSICLLAVLFTFLYARTQVFFPLILARNMLLELIDPDSKRDLNDSGTLIETIERMKETLKQRDALAFQLKSLANTDTLTGVSNRAALEEYLSFKANQPEAFSNTALIVLDIDDFKQVNDQYGHLVGDDVIRHIAEQLKANVRSTDLVVRYGGDEFLVILENCAYGGALYIADQMRCAISHTTVRADVNQELNVSVSAGVAVGAESWTGLLAKADQSLLRVKAKGKNAVEG